VTDPEGALLGALEALTGGEDPGQGPCVPGSTKFGESPTREEMVSLLQEWAATEFGEVCPHGKPITKRVTLADLLREFGRVYTISQNY
jgi:DNA mismatch repair protein MutL